MATKALDNRLRRLPRREGYAIIKSKARQWSLDNQKGYMLVDAKTNGAVGVGFRALLESYADRSLSKSQSCRKFRSPTRRHQNL